MYRPILRTPCKICETWYLNSDGTPNKTRPRRPDDPPNCQRCPKLTHADALSDERVMYAIQLCALGVSEEDAIIKSDTWLFAACRLIKARMAQKAQEEAQRG